MNIILVADLYYPLVNGCSYFIQRLALQLKERGHQVIVIAPSESFSYTIKEIDGITVYGMRSYPTFVYPKFRLCFLPFSGKRIEKIVNNFKPDVIHFQWHFGVNRAVLKVAKKMGIRTIGTNHFMPETMVHYLPFSKYVARPLIHLAWKDFARVFKQMDQITTPTQIAADLITPYFKQPVIPISCGIDLQRFRPGQCTKAVRARYGIPEKPVLLYVGRLDREKNLDVVIKASAKALKDLDFHLIIAGCGTEKKGLTNLVKELNLQASVTFTGFVPNEVLPTLYCIANCFIIAGTAELQSIATMEAMASALPVLAVDAVALPELVHEGVNGYLFQIADINEFAKKIKRMTQDKQLRDTMGKESIDCITAHEIGVVMDKYEMIYKPAAVIPSI
ncbi:MAG: glycosyltransferase [Legionellales bacterium]|nr:glycosyltransferase [Legionellales bacterium]